MKFTAQNIKYAKNSIDENSLIQTHAYVSKRDGKKFHLLGERFAKRRKKTIHSLKFQPYFIILDFITI